MKNDPNYKTQRKLLDEIVSNLQRLENGELTLVELNNHLNIVRTLYERTLVLQYKAFEQHAKENETLSLEIEDNNVNDDKWEEAEFEETIAESTSPILEFDFSQNTQQETDIQHFIFEGQDIYSPEISPQAEQSTPEQSLVYKRFFSILERIRNRVGRSPFTTLSDSFGLNERLLFINELFEGSNDDFVRAIEFLETIPIPESTVSFFEDLAQQYHWDIDSQEVEDFMLKICRKYV